MPEFLIEGRTSVSGIFEVVPSRVVTLNDLIFNEVASRRIQRVKQAFAGIVETRNLLSNYFQAYQTVAKVLSKYYFSDDQVLRRHNWTTRIERTSTYVKKLLVSTKTNKETGALEVISSICEFFAKMFSIKNDGGLLGIFLRFAKIISFRHDMLKILGYRESLFKRLEIFLTSSILSSEENIQKLV